MKYVLLYQSADDVLEKAPAHFEAGLGSARGPDQRHSAESVTGWSGRSVSIQVKGSSSAK
jgi:hypothetical protein